MEKIYLFDVDGTLTPARMPMDESFAEFFDNFVNLNKVVLISGSDYAKIQEQVPQAILDKCDGVYGCSGAEYFEKGQKVYAKEHSFPITLIDLCKDFIKDSAFHLRTGNHIEERPGMINISSVGRNATEFERSTYHAWDRKIKERIKFVEKINASELGYEASAGGEISIDIVPNGWNKSVVKGELLEKYPDASLIFFGDRIVKNGNDLPLAEALKEPQGKHASYPVNSFEETRELLKTEMQSLEAKL